MKTFFQVVVFTVPVILIIAAKGWLLWFGFVLSMLVAFVSVVLIPNLYERELKGSDVLAMLLVYVIPLLFFTHYIDKENRARNLYEIYMFENNCRYVQPSPYDPGDYICKRAKGMDYEDFKNIYELD